MKTGFFIFVFVAASVSVSTASVSSPNSNQMAQSLLEIFSASLAQGNTTSSEDLVALNLENLRSALNISLPLTTGSVNASALTNLTSIIQNYLASAAASNTSAPLVKAASGLAEALLSGGSSMTSFQTHLKDLQERYQAARKYLRTDDAVRIGGYLATLDSLALSAISAYPIAEASLYVAELSLCTAVTGLVGGILYTVSTSLGLSGSLVSLQLTLQSVYPRGQPGGPGGPRSTSASLNNSMFNSIATSADEVNSQLLAFALGGGLISPLSLATNVLYSSAASLDRLSSFTAPQNLLNRLNLLQLQVQSGPFAKAFTAASSATTGAAIGSVAAAAGSLAGVGGRRSMQTGA